MSFRLCIFSGVGGKPTDLRREPAERFFPNVSAELDREKNEYYTMSNMHSLLTERWNQGINTLQS